MSSQSTIQTDTMPLVSVVIPSYNNAEHIGEAIDSVLAQDYTPLEIIVIDDGSTDHTPDIIASYGDQIIFLRQPNQGAAVARNLGIKTARGQYIAFLDADDVWWSKKLSHQMTALLASPYPMVYSRFIWWESNADGCYPSASAQFATERHPRLSSGTLSSGWIYADLLLDCIVWTSTVIVQKTLLEQVGLFNPELRKGQDYDLWLRLSRYCPMLGLEQPTALYRRHSSSITESLKSVNYGYVIISRMLQEWGDTGPDGRQPPRHLLNAHLYNLCIQHGLGHLRYGDIKIALDMLREALKYSELRPKRLILLALAVLKTLGSRLCH